MCVAYINVTDFSRVICCILLYNPPLLWHSSTVTIPYKTEENIVAVHDPAGAGVHVRVYHGAAGLCLPGADPAGPQQPPGRHLHTG